MSDSYFKEFCQKCNKKNWFTKSEFDGDCSKEDDSCVLECFNCHHKFLDPQCLNYGSKEEVYKDLVDCDLWEEVNGNEEEFLKQYTYTNPGREHIE